MFLEQLNTFGLNPILLISILLVVGFLAGFINTLAGGGSIISYTLFTGLGLSPVAANGTLRAGVVMQTLMASINFKQAGLFSIRKGSRLGIYTLLGSIAGAYVAVGIDPHIFSYFVGGAMLFILFLLFTNPKRWIEGRQNKNIHLHPILELLLYFAIGFYGGFIHIGVGFFLLAALVLISGYNLLEANALKIFIVFIYSPFALLIYFLNGQIDLSLALVASVGNVVGGILASKLAIKKGSRFIHWFLVIIVLLFILKTFKVYTWF